MAENSKIEWCHNTFNPWIGCSKVSTGCKNCYAEAMMDRRMGKAKWGEQGTRVVTSAAYWKQPFQWYRKAALAGERQRVFCASLADVGEDRPELVEPRAKLSEMIIYTWGWLDWLLLTKRPENMARLFPAEVLRACWVGTSVEDQEQADKRIPELLKCPAAVRFVSFEPLLGAINVPPVWLDGVGYRADGSEFAFPRIDWAIIGGESGSGARPCEVQWIRSLKDQCAAAGVPVFVKQIGAAPVGQVIPGSATSPTRNLRKDGWLHDPKGGNPDEWPSDLRVRQFPTLTERPTR